MWFTLFKSFFYLYIKTNVIVKFANFKHQFLEIESNIKLNKSIHTFYGIQNYMQL